MKLVLENNQTVNVAHRRADELLRRLYGWAKERLHNN
jgi:hypothetical protein